MNPPDVTQGLPVIAPNNMLPVQVVRREEIAPGVVNLLIVLPGTQQAPVPHLPGQFVTLALPTPRETLYRSYSLCGIGDADQPWEITIKRMRLGAVSNFFYRHVAPGTLLYSSLPRGSFVLPAVLGPDQRFVFVAAGSGITPIFGMLRTIANLPPDQRPLVQLHYASKSVDDIIFYDALSMMDRNGTWLQQYHYLSSEGEHMTAEQIVERAGRMAAWAHWYMCGPESLKRDLIALLERDDVPAEQIHAEVFATSQRPPYRVAESGATSGGDLHINDTGQDLDVQPQETLLQALERHGYRTDFSCRAGACGTCKVRVVSGTVEPVGEALAAADRAAGYALSCIARPIGAVTLASGGRPPAGVALTGGAQSSGGRSGAELALVRLSAAVGVGALLLTAWNFTNHRPLSWEVQAAPASSPTVAPASTSPVPGAPTATTHPGVPTATPRPNVPTATPRPGAPTATPRPNVPTATPTVAPTPKPTPKATSTPSPAR